MKVCFITDISVQDVFGLEWINRFAEKTNVSVITFSSYQPEKVDQRIAVYHTMLRGPGIMRLLQSVRFAKEKLRIIKPDVVISLDAGRHAFVSVLTGFHPFILFSYGSDVAYRTRLLRIGNLITRIIIRRADRILSQDIIAKKRMIDLGVKPEKIFVKHWGVDTCFFHPSRKMKCYDIINIHGYNTTDYRYLDIYLKAIYLLKKRGVKIKALLLGNNGYYDKIIHDLGIMDVLNQDRFVSRDHLREYLWRSKIMIDPVYPKYGSDAFGYGIGIIQAMANGTPLVLADRPVTKLTGMDCWFYGKTFTHCDPVSLADTIESLLKNENEQKKISKENRRSAILNFDSKKNTDDIINDIQKLVYRYQGYQEYRRQDRVAREKYLKVSYVPIKLNSDK